MSESTKIDSLSIEIISNSTGAVQSIDALAASLGKLKQNGSVGVAVKNLNNLATALRSFTNTSSVARTLGTLADAMGRLKEVGSVGGVGNSVKKLGESLKSLDGVNIDNVAPKIRAIADAVRPLSEVKAGGLNSMINGLRKLDEVTDKLDDETITRFAQRIEKLNAVLGPLSTKMTTIQTGFRGINTKARTAGDGVAHLGKKVNTTTLNMASMITVIQGAVSALRPLVRLLSDSISAAMEWDGIAARFGRGFGNQAEDVYSWVQRLNEELGINTQQFMQYSSTYATMLTGFGVGLEDASTMALGYAELTYDIWAGYNDIYKSYADAADAVRSAIAGEVEPIRRAGFTIIESTLEQTAANHGLQISLENATEAQKSYLRYLTLVDQAQSQGLVGTYAKEMNTAEGVMRTFSQQLKSLTQAFGSLFLPILVKVMPYLQAFVELLTDAIHAVAKFFGITIQGVDWSDYGDGLGGLGESANQNTEAVEGTTQALKELKNAAIGIDELNVISPPSRSAGSGANGDGGSGFDDLDIESLWDESIFTGIQSQVKELKEEVLDWLLGLVPLVAGIGTALGGWRLTNLLADLDDVDPKLLNLAKGVTIAGISLVVGKLVWDFTGAYLEGGDEKELLKALGTTVLGAALAYYLAGGGKAGKGGAGFTIAVSGVVTLTRLGIEIGEGTVDFGDPETWVTGLVGVLETAVGSVLTWKVIGPIVTKAWSSIAPKLGKTLATKGGWIGAIIAAIIFQIEFLVENWEKVTEAVKSYYEKYIKPMFDDIGGYFDVLAEELKPLIDLIKSIGDWLKETGIWDFFANLTEIIGGVIFALGSGGIAGALSSLVRFVRGVIQGFTGVVQTISGILGLIVGVFTGDTEKIKESWEKLKEGIVNILEGLYDSTLGPIDAFVKGVVDWFFELYDVLVGHSIVPDTIDEIVEWFLSLPGKVWDKIGEFVDGIIERFTDLGSGIRNKLSDAWTKAKDWWNNKSSLSTYFPKIGSIRDKLSAAWDTAKTWWNNTKAALSTYTPKIGSIRDKLKSAWDKAKTWWNENVKLSIPSLSFKVTYDTSNLGAVKQAIVSAFNLPGWPKLSFAANGGIFDAGSLIWAGERGAEIVANAGGGKTGVMNVDQMQDAVYEGVYAAVMAAMRAGAGNGGGQAVNVYLDSKQITATVEQRQRERGASIMGRQVYSY